MELMNLAMLHICLFFIAEGKALLDIDEANYDPAANLSKVLLTN